MCGDAAVVDVGAVEAEAGSAEGGRGGRRACGLSEGLGVRV